MEGQGIREFLLLCDYIITHATAVCKEVFVKNIAIIKNFSAFFVCLDGERRGGGTISPSFLCNTFYNTIVMQIETISCDILYI